MFGERLIDLDELILRCRSEQAKQYIAEAVACYRAGAFRAAIVATWVAVVFDFLHKLEELALTGDQEAEQKRSEYEKIRQAGDVRSSLKFEEELLLVARDKFEFISPMEFQDLARLKDDRNRCAHPSMTADSEVYQPAAELARYHIRNAVTCLLQHAPVQGKAAMERLLRQLESNYFPMEASEALRQLEHGPLARPRQSLLRNFTLVVLKAMLHGELESNAFRRHAAALNGIRIMHREAIERILEQDFLKIVRAIEDSRRDNILRFLVAIPDTQRYLANDVIALLQAYIVQMPLVDRIEEFHLALDSEPLRISAQNRLRTLNVNALTVLITFRPRREFFPRILDIYARAENYDYANKVANALLLPIVPYLTKDDMVALFDVAAHNSQVRESHQFFELVKTVQVKEIYSKETWSDILVGATLQSEPLRLKLLPLLDVSGIYRLFDAIGQEEVADEGNPELRIRRWFRLLEEESTLTAEQLEEIRVSYQIKPRLEAIEED